MVNCNLLQPSSSTEEEAVGTLVARAVPLTTSQKPEIGAVDAMIHVSSAKTSPKSSVDTIAASLDALQLSKSSTTPSAKSSVQMRSTRRSDAAISPADFVNLQSMRSSALARKTNTTSKFSRDCRNLFADLLSPTVKEEEKKPEKKTKSEKVEKEESLAKTEEKTTKKEKKNSSKPETAEKEASKGTNRNSEDTTSAASKQGVKEQEKSSPEHKEGNPTNKAKTTEEDEDEKFLLSRGPVRASRTPVNYHPYGSQNPQGGDNLASSGAMYGTAAQSTVYDPSSFSSNVYSYGYDCGASQYNNNGAAVANNNVMAGFDGQLQHNYGSGGNYSSGYMGDNRCLIDSRESTPDTVHSDLGYGSACSPHMIPYATNNAQNCVPQSNHLSPNSNNYSSFAVGSAPSSQVCAVHDGQRIGSTSLSIHGELDEFSAALNSASFLAPKEKRSSDKEATDEHELPDALSDFILKYSRRYTPSSHDASMERSAGGSQGNSPRNSTKNGSTISSADSSPLNYYGGADIEFISAPNSNKYAPGDESLCASPLSAISAPKCSPGQPHGGWAGDYAQQNAPTASASHNPNASSAPQVRKAKERLRELITNDDMDEAWAWTCKCIQNYPGALCYQDTDRDTLLHIVTLHLDLAKIYALVEQMLKMESEYSGGELSGARRQKPFDMPNRVGETPLFLAVEKRETAVVDYLLEAGAQPNAQNSRPERDAPLHYAAARGMNKIVQILCSYSNLDVNLANGMGLTPILYAVKNHGVLDEESHTIIDNSATIQMLLKFGADPAIPDGTNGKTVIHYAIERLNADLIEIFQSQLSESAMTELVNKADLSRETPMRTLQELSGGVDEATRSKLCLILITCGSEAN